MGRINLSFFKESIKLLYLKLVKINDTPQKISLGFGLGVFLGIFPGTGPIAALFLALIFRVNRASALIGSLLTNTWLSFVTFLAALKIGSLILHVDWREVHQGSVNFLKNFSWLNLFKLSALKIMLPLILGYILIGFCLGILAYLISLILILNLKHKKS